MDVTDIILFVIHNKWWLIALVPFALVILVVRLMNPR